MDAQWILSQWQEKAQRHAAEKSRRCAGEFRKEKIRGKQTSSLKLDVVSCESMRERRKVA